jgi:hypothetical protein
LIWDRGILEIHGRHGAVVSGRLRAELNSKRGISVGGVGTEHQHGNPGQRNPASGIVRRTKCG